MHHTTNTIEQPYATGLTRSNIERALADAGKQTATSSHRTWRCSRTFTASAASPPSR